MRTLPLIDVSNHDTCVRRVPIFAGLTPEQQNKVAAHVRPALLSRGEFLHHAGDRVGHLFVVHSGSVKLVHPTASGRERLVRVAHPGEVVGEHAFLTGERPDYHVQAAEDARLCVFDHGALTRLVGELPAISLAMLRTLSERLEDAERRLSLSGTDVPSRVATYLLDLPATSRDGHLVVRLPLAKKDVASYLGTTPESLSRAFDRLERAGLVDVNGSEIALADPAALEEVGRTGLGKA